MAIAFTGILTSCWKNENREIMGFAPVYGAEAELQSVTLAAPQAVENGGKIYVEGNILFQVESGRGIHVTDISAPATPQKKAFIKVAGSQEVAVKNGLIYTNNLNDLVILEYAGNTIKVVKRIPAFKNMGLSVLPPERGYFECPDKNKGVITGWQKKLLTNPKCEY